MIATGVPAMTCRRRNTRQSPDSPPTRFGGRRLDEAVRIPCPGSARGSYCHANRHGRFEACTNLHVLTGAVFLPAASSMGGGRPTVHILPLALYPLALYHRHPPAGNGKNVASTGCQRRTFPSLPSPRSRLRILFCCGGCLPAAPRPAALIRVPRSAQEKTRNARHTPGLTWCGQRDSNPYALRTQAPQACLSASSSTAAQWTNRRMRFLVLTDTKLDASAPSGSCHCNGPDAFCQCLFKISCAHLTVFYSARFYCAAPPHLLPPHSASGATLM